MNGSTYWYEEENCLVNSLNGDVTLVQVMSGSARVVSRRSIPRSECQSQVNRYDTFVPKSFEQLYLDCRALLEGSCAASARTDERDVLQSCTAPGDSDCLDNCGEGFSLRRWDFGTVAQGI
jgi:hypothetical protein